MGMIPDEISEWQLEPVPKAARLALDAIGLTLPEKPCQAKTYSPNRRVTA